MGRKKLIPLLATAALLFTGCGNGEKIHETKVNVPEYEKIIYDSVEACRGDITPVLTLKLSAVSYEKKSYYPLYDDMEVESVNVAVGDKVKKGDVLITFKSGDIASQIKEYQNQVEQNNLLIDHYTRLSQLDASVDYSADLARLAEDTKVANLYIQELQAKLSFYSICAEDDGSVYILSDLLDYGTVGTSNNLITLIYGNGQFEAETTDDFDFQVGETYIATYGVAEYELELISVEEKGEDVNGETVRTLRFQAAAENTDFSNRDKLTMTLEKPTLTDVVYVPKECVFDVDDEYYVYLLDDDGFRDAVRVTIGSTVDGYTVIESGLNEGDRVVIQ